MLFFALIVVVFVIYLFIEEKERRHENPAAPKWFRRVSKSLVRHLWFLGSVVAAFWVQIARDKDFDQSLFQAEIGVGIFLVLVLHAATLSLPRKG
jgi:hypothetical protein